MPATRTEKLLTAYLDRENATTALNYRHSRLGFAEFCRCGDDIQAAIGRLLAGNAQAANVRVTRWKRSMIGTRDKKGKLVSGRGLAPATVNLRLAVVRGLVKKARQAGLINWELDVPALPSERVHDVRGPGMEALRQLLAAAQASSGPQGFRDYAIIRVFAGTGLRRRELAGLDLDDFEASAPLPSGSWPRPGGRRSESGFPKSARRQSTRGSACGQRAGTRRGSRI